MGACDRVPVEFPVLITTTLAAPNQAESLAGSGFRRDSRLPQVTFGPETDLPISGTLRVAGSEDECRTGNSSKATSLGF